MEIDGHCKIPENTPSISMFSIFQYCLVFQKQHKLLLKEFSTPPSLGGVHMVSEEKDVE